MTTSTHPSTPAADLKDIQKLLARLAKDIHALNLLNDDTGAPVLSPALYTTPEFITAPCYRGERLALGGQYLGHTFVTSGAARCWYRQDRWHAVAPRPFTIPHHPAPQMYTGPRVLLTPAQFTTLKRIRRTGSSLILFYNVIVFGFPGLLILVLLVGFTSLNPLLGLLGLTTLISVDYAVNYLKYRFLLTTLARDLRPALHELVTTN